MPLLLIALLSGLLLGVLVSVVVLRRRPRAEAMRALSEGEAAVWADTDDALMPFAARRFPYPPDLSDTVELEWRTAFWLFIESGAIEDGYRTHVTECAGCQTALTRAFAAQSNARQGLGRTIAREQRRFEREQARQAGGQ